MRSKKNLAALLLGVVSFAASPSHATVTQFVRATAGNLVDTTQTYGPVLAEDNGVNRRANALADYGVLKLFSTTSGFSNGGFFFNAARASAQTYDTLMFGGRATTLPGIATVKIRIAGLQSGQASISPDTDINSDFAYQINTFTTGGASSEYVASRNLAIDVNGITDRSGINAGAGYNPVSSIIGYHLVRIPFLFGVPLGLQQTASCITGVRAGSGGNGGDATCSYGNSIYWGGVDSVTDDMGNAVSGWSVGSSSSFNYRVASPLDPLVPTGVPEPRMWLTMTLGLGLIGSAVRRRRTRAVPA